MATSNFRQSIEGLFAAVAATSLANRFRRPYVFGAICIASGVGAALGAFFTEEFVVVKQMLASASDSRRDPDRRVVALRAEHALGQE
jgi:hypothetical protein